MRSVFPTNLFSNVRGDLFGGITAAVVALPLALAFGVASGAGPVAGLYGAIALGFFAALFGGTPSQVSGPTGPMTVIMASVITQYQHDFALVFTVVMMGGMFQIIFGLLKIGRYINYVPYPVVSGFMSGIGLIIIILQLGSLTGYDSKDGVLEALHSLPGHLGKPVLPAAVLGLMTLAIILLIPKGWRNHLPPSLAALIVGTAAGIFLIKGAPVLGEVPEGLPRLHMPIITVSELPSMVSASLTLAMLGTVDSLLTSLVADNFTRTQHRSDRELIGQGIGNIFAGFIGGLPGAGATMRTVVNIRAGGRTPLSGMMHSITLLACVAGLGFLVEDIPKAVLAGILLKVGWDIIDWRFLGRLTFAGIKDADRQATLVMLAVLLLTVFVDLIMAVAIGIIIESLITARRLATHQIDDVQFATAGGKPDVRHRLSEEEERIIDEAQGKLLLLRFTGPLSFGTARDLSSRLQSGYGGLQAVVIDLTDARMMDISIMVTLADMIDDFRKDNVEIYLSGTGNKVFRTLKSHRIIAGVSPSNILEDRLATLRKAAAGLEAVEQPSISQCHVSS